MQTEISPDNFNGFVCLCLDIISPSGFAIKGKAKLGTYWSRDWFTSL